MKKINLLSYLLMSLIIMSACSNDKEEKVITVPEDSSSEIESSSTLISSSLLDDLETENSEFEDKSKEEVDMNSFSWNEISKTGEATTERIGKEEAIELARKYMVSNDSSMSLENYSFTPHSSLIDEDGSSYYSINVRQNASGEFQSMAIGTIYVNAETGECHWL